MYQPTAEELADFEHRLQEVTIEQLYAMAEEFGEDAARGVASRFADHSTFRILAAVTMDQETHEPVPGGLWLQVDVLVPNSSDDWLPLFRVNARAIGMSAD